MPEERSFSHLVVVGSSAGGVEALSELVSTLPEGFPAPIVAVQHLDPRRESHLEQILTRRSTLPVRTLKEEQSLPLESGVVFVVPADRHVSITDSDIHLQEDTYGRPKPSIDLLFSSAAEMYGERLVAVVLTGTGSDGTDGARAVKKAGGTVIIQNPDTAAHPGMPRSLAPSTVDIIADLGKIGSIIHDLLRGIEVPAEPDEQRKLREFLEEVRDTNGIDFRSYKTPTIMRRLQRRIVGTDSGDLDGYRQYLTGHPDEYQKLVNSFLIKVTEFFRDRELFDFLRDRIMPELVETARTQGNQLRIWSAGCATGEEAYSLAILISEVLQGESEHFNVRIFATDLDEEAVNFARRGIYPESALAGLPEEYVSRYFAEEDGNYQVKKKVRSMVVFGQHDLAKRAPFPRVDLVVCRNVLIYFTTELQKRALQLFAYSLKDGGYLILGKSETPSSLGEYFSLHDKQRKVYSRLGKRFLMPLSRMDSMPPPRERTHPDTRPSTDSGASVDGSADGSSPVGRHRGRPETRGGGDDFLHEFPVGVVVIDRKYDIRSINTAARRLLSINDPAIGEDLLHIVHGAHYEELREAMDATFEEGRTAGVASFAVEEVTTGEQRYLQVTAYPQRDTDGRINSAVVVVNDVTEAVRERMGIEERLETVNADLERVGREAQEQKERQEAVNRRLIEANRQLAEANLELTTVNEELQATNEQYVVADEETQAATEEVETFNEELQATNEELETLNEELQATIEELNTTNEDLNARSVELQRLAAESEDHYRTSEDSRGRLQEILRQVPSMVAILRGSDHVFEFVNPSYVRLSGRSEGRLIGRPLQEVFPANESLHELLDRVHETGEPQVAAETPVRFDRSGDGTPEDASLDFVYQPLQNAKGEVKGIIVQGVDGTDGAADRERADTLANRLEQEGSRLGTVLSSLPDPVLAVDATGAVLFANRAFTQTFGPTETGETDPQGFVPRNESGDPIPQEERPRGRAARGEQFRAELSVETTDGTVRRFEATGRPLGDGGQGGVMVVREIAQ